MIKTKLTTLDVIIPNLHWRYSGVTATNRMIAPRLSRKLSLGWIGRDRPEGVAALSAGDLMGLRFVRRASPCVWHARRNNEMIAGVLLRALGWPLTLVFTSAAQRRHTWLTRWLMRRMDAVIAPSEQAKSFLDGPATVVLHGIDLDRYAPPDNRAAAFAEANLPGKYAIGCFGRVRAQKGTDIFVEAMCRLLPRHPDFTAVIVGAITPDQTQFADRLRQTIAAAGLQRRIVMTGERSIDEVPEWYRRLSIFVFSSRNEGFGLTLLEAMASGVALVATRAGAAESVVKNGDTGVLVPADDVDAMVAALEPLMRDPRAAEAMGRRARAAALEAFGVDAEAEKIAAVYASIAKAR